MLHRIATICGDNSAGVLVPATMALQMDTAEHFLVKNPARI
jgi:hypothetical protein